MPREIGPITARFVDNVLAVTPEAIPPEAIDVANHVVLDGSSTMLAGSTEPEGVGRLATRWARENAGSPVASVVAAGFKALPISAAFANGTMAHALDFDNVWHPRNHPMSPTLPAILALAEKYGFSGQRVLAAVVVAFEVQNRLRMASIGLDTGKGFHKPGMTGTMGAAAACGWLLNLDREQLAMTMGLAGSRAGSLSINSGTMTKSSHSGHAARNGVECAELVKMGWTASTKVFDAGGFFDTFFGDRYDAELLVADFGNPYRMVDPGLGFKKHPCNNHTQRPIDAALELRRDHQIEPGDIVNVEIEAPVFDYVNRPRPISGLEGKFSLQYTTGIALLDGEVTVDSFSNERRFSPDIEELLSRTQVIYDPEIPQSTLEMLFRVRVTLRGGQTVECTKQRISGMVGVPLSREERERKFYSCATRVMSRDRADQLLATIDQFAGLDAINDYMDLMCTTDGGTAT